MKINRVLYFLDFPNAFGGAANTLLKQAAVMKKYVKDILVTIPLDDSGFVIGEFAERCRQYGLSYAFQKYIVSITAEMIDVIGLAKNYDTIEKYINDYNPDLVHSTQINVCVEMACRKLGIPHIMNIYPCAENIFKLEYPDIFPHYHICDSKYYQNRWKIRLQLDSVCIRNICNEVKEEKYKFQEPTLVCVGVMSEWKNQLGIIKAIQQLISEGILLHIYLLGKADNAYGQKCIDYIERNDLGNWIKVKGFVSDAENEIARCDALVCGSIIESFPNVIGEAMANRTVVISTPVGGVPELLIDDKNAYLCDGFSEEDICIAIKRFYDQRGTQVQEKLIENAFHTYLTEFSATAVADKLLSYYKHAYMDNAVRTIPEVSSQRLLEPYNSYIEVFKRHEVSFQDPYKIRKMIWLIPYIKKSLKNESHRKLIIWGTGSYGATAMAFAELYFPELSIRYFVDKEKQGKYLGYPIIKTENSCWKDSLVWIAFMNGQAEAVKILRNKGLEYHIDFFFLAPMNL